MCKVKMPMRYIENIFFILKYEMIRDMVRKCLLAFTAFNIHRTLKWCLIMAIRVSWGFSLGWKFYVWSCLVQVTFNVLGSYLSKGGKIDSSLLKGDLLL